MSKDAQEVADEGHGGGQPGRLPGVVGVGYDEVDPVEESQHPDNPNADLVQHARGDVIKPAMPLLINSNRGMI